MTALELIDRRKRAWRKDPRLSRDEKLREAFATEIIRNVEFRESVIRNPEYLIELCMVIVDKDKNTVPFFFNEVQADFLKVLNQAITDYGEGRLSDISLMVLKGRQQGFTSLITAYQLAREITSKNFEGFTLADTSSNAEAIFENKAKYPYANLPDRLRPKEKYNNRRELRFEKNNSTWSVETASSSTGRSRTINFLHASECAFYEVGMGTIYASLGGALTKNCIKIYESTANGMNDYYDMWTSGNHINCFYEWWRTPEYFTEFESTDHRKDFKKKERTGKDWIWQRLRWLKDIGLTDTQRYWYYKQWLIMPRKDLIKQEFPCTEGEAFLMSGRPVFNIERVSERIEELKGLEPERGKFRYEWNNPDSKDRIIDSSITWVPDPNGFIRMYQKPKSIIPYVIGGDTKGEGKDFYAGTVINNNNGRRVATLKMDIMESSAFSHQMYCLGRYYNDALIGVEMNFNTAPIEELQRLLYPKQYVRRRYDDYTKSVEQKFGWKTDGNTRPIIIDREVEEVENNIDRFYDIETLTEMLTFVYDKNGKPNHMSTKHDDLLFSDMIASEIRSQQDRIFHVKGKTNTMKWRKDQWEDYYNGSEEDKKLMVERWGPPN